MDPEPILESVPDPGIPFFTHKSFKFFKKDYFGSYFIILILYQ